MLSISREPTAMYSIYDKYLDGHARATSVDTDQTIGGLTLHCYVCWTLAGCFEDKSRKSSRAQITLVPASILRKSTSGRHRPVKVAIGPSSARQLP